eukprot:CAMPEP_0174238852 /NCGR_PEP_ID=MMETSP0417-20130205/12788_1 /TAXON_ID=242541 /ORGANISM="Mayorella sp, Strain BSH-02190019" /LENGTH=228 /DNA_ID=CAMNT_0015317739 /DNA_START=83 /DNA_END=769 /DNA_ORIENTATION=-
MSRPRLENSPLSALVLALALTVLLEVHPAEGMYTFLKEGETRCFIEEVPKDTLVLATYEASEHLIGGAGPSGRVDEMKITTTVRGPSGTLVLQRSLPMSARVAFTSQVGGEHTICFQTTSQRWFGGGMTLKFILDIETGSNAVDYKEIAQSEHLSNLEVSVRRLNDRVRSIRREQTYQREREEEHRDTSESSNSRVVWWSLTQTAVLIISSLYQIYYLKKFFKRKKLV